MGERMIISRKSSSDYALPNTIRHFLLITVPVVLLLSLVLSFMRPIWGDSELAHAATSSAAAMSSSGQVNIPYFGSSSVPFNQTSIFWFGKVTPTDNYIDVRMGYNDTELYVNLNVVDQYVWYDPNAQAPNLNTGDTATIYLDTAQSRSAAPQTTSYKFVAQVNWYQSRTTYQAAYQGNGTTWVSSTTPFTTVSTRRGTGLNGSVDSGWSMEYDIPFTSLGLSGPPAQGAAWDLAVKDHNQTGATGKTSNVKLWPTTAKDTAPSSWGPLVYGLPTYQPPSTTNNATYTIQNGLNGQVVTDGMVGGGLNCLSANSGNNRWTQFGIQTYPQATRVDIENEQDVSDFNCFSKYYITFPMSLVPTGKGIVSATVTLYLNGNFGGNSGPNPSLIQVASTNQGWSASTLDWNNAPQVGEIISRTTVNLCGNCPKPGIAYTWDVSLAAANAYAVGQPLHLVFYSMDSPYHTGKYFDSSYGYSTGLPSLQVTAGDLSGGK